MNKKRNVFIGFMVIILLTLTLFQGVKIYGNNNKLILNNETDEVTDEVTEIDLDEDLDLNEDNKAEEISSNEKNNDYINEMISNMSLEEKVGQLFIVNLEDINNGIDVTSFNEVMKEKIQQFNIGGVIFFQKNLVDREQVSGLINELQNSSKLPLFISVDEEGGIVARLGNTPAMNTTSFENMIDVGNSEDYYRAYEIANTIGREIKEFGFNLNFAPVGDVLTNSENSEIGDRSFGNDPELVAEMVKRYIDGLQDNDVSATLKHFPGHGNTFENSHIQTSYTDRTLEEVREVEFIPFEAGIEQGVDFILISHLSASNITGSDVPASLSSVIVTDILREELGFNNIVITDALNMGAVSNNYYPGEAAIQSINAGVDILLMSPDFENVYYEVIDAVNNGDISEERVNDSVKRILNVKLNRGLIK